MSTEDLSSQRVPPTQLDTAHAQRLAEQKLALTKIIGQIASSQSLQAFADEGAFGPTLMRKFQPLENKRKRTSKEEEAEQKDKSLLEVARIERISSEFNQRNPELLKRSLSLLLSRISVNDTKEEILKKVLEMYPDHSLADDALDFLLETASGKHKEEIRKAKEDLNFKYGREVKAGKNIAEQAREFSKQGLGSPTGLRSLYREVTGNPRDANTLFNELTSKFTYDKMKTAIDFLLHSLGGDLKSKGPSISAGELHQLLSEARKLQGILGIFRFFKSRMNLISSAFARQGLTLPMLITFEILARQFMKAIQERYPSADKLLKMALQLGLSEEILAQVIILTQMRDGIRQVAPRLFKNDQHRQDLLNAFMDAIEELDERLEEEDEEEEEKEEEEGDKK